MKQSAIYSTIISVLLCAICLNASDDDRWDTRFFLSGIDGDIDVLAADENALYAGGIFYNAGGVPGTYNIAKWDGRQWHALGDGLNNRIEAICIVGNDIYAGGMFTDAGGNTDADYLARWDGQNWHAVGTAINNFVFAIVMYNGK